MALIDIFNFMNRFICDLVYPKFQTLRKAGTLAWVRAGPALSRAVKATEPFVLKGAGHPAYLDQPDKWHQILLNFMKKLQLLSSPV